MRRVYAEKRDSCHMLSFIALMLIAAATLYPFIPLTAEEETFKITYNVNIYDSISSMYSRNPAISGEATVTFKTEKTGYTPTGIHLRLLKGGTIALLTSGTLEKIVTLPSLNHFALPTKILLDAKEKGESLTPQGWRLKYISMSAISVGKGMEQGYEFILHFNGGSKEVLYDDNTGILLSELFYIKSGIAGTLIVYLTVVSAPAFIGDEGIPKRNLLAFDMAAALIMVGSLIAILARRKYRIL